MSTPNCGHESVTAGGKVYTCAGDGYYRSADGDVRFGSMAGKANYEKDQLVSTYLKAAAAAAVGVAVVHVLTR